VYIYRARCNGTHSSSNILKELLKNNNHRTKLQRADLSTKSPTTSNYSQATEQLYIRAYISNQLSQKLHPHIKKVNMMLPSSLLASIFLFLASTKAAPAPLAAADDGQWRPAQYGGSLIAGSGVPAVSPTVQTKPLDTTAATPLLVAASQTKGVATAAATKAGTLTAAAWESSVTWPAGCELWANPCPSGAIISGGGVAGYTNGFTSYLTETNSDGIITGMPPVATVAAGVTGKADASTLSTITRGSSNDTITSSRTPSSTLTGFSSGQSDSPLQSNDASMLTTSSIIIAAAVMAFLC
jgi:hypothetical protein